MLGLQLQCFALPPAGALFLTPTCPQRAGRVNHGGVTGIGWKEHDTSREALPTQLGAAPLEDRRCSLPAGGGRSLGQTASKRTIQQRRRRLRRRRRRGHPSPLLSSFSEDAAVPLPPRPKASDGYHADGSGSTAKDAAFDGSAGRIGPQAAAAASRASLLSAEALSLFRNPDTGSDIWLLGVEHTMEGYKKFVERVIREVKPDTVMLELCWDRATDPCILPLGEASQGEDGLWWFTPDTTQPGDAAAVESKKLANNDATTVGVARGSAVGQQGARPRKLGVLFSKALATLPRRVVVPATRLAAVARSAFIRLVYVEDETVVLENNEMWAACCEAQACGARILLGDRDHKVTADGEPGKMEEDLEVASWTEGGRAGFDRHAKGMAMLLDLVDRRLAHGFEMPMTRAIMRKYGEWHKRCMPAHFAFMLDDRNKVMVDNLLSVEGSQAAVAVVGFTHLDGMENLLAARGWEPQSCASD